MSTTIKMQDPKLPQKNTKFAAKKSRDRTARSVWSADTEVSVPCVVPLPHPGAFVPTVRDILGPREGTTPGCGALQTLRDMGRRTKSARPLRSALFVFFRG
ncbi:MAG: hypothetical protein QOJ40_2812 [Verrucomicrobiota bacterium]